MRNVIGNDEDITITNNFYVMKIVNFERDIKSLYQNI